MAKRRLRPGFNSGTISDCNFSKNSCLSYPGVGLLTALPPPVSIRPKSIQDLSSNSRICNVVSLSVPDLSPMPRSSSTREKTPSEVSIGICGWPLELLRVWITLNFQFSYLLPRARIRSRQCPVPSLYGTGNPIQSSMHARKAILSTESHSP